MFPLAACRPKHQRTAEGKHGYAKKVEVPINATIDGELTGFQVRIAIVKGSGANAAGTIYLNNHALNWPYDLRVYAADEETAIDFWREEYDATDGTWVIKIPTIAATGTTSIWIYYGKEDDTDASSIADAFSDGADFRAGVVPAHLSGTNSPLVRYDHAADICKTSPDSTVSAEASHYEAWPAIAALANGDKLVVYRTADSDTHAYDSSGRVILRKYSSGEWGTEVIVVDNNNDDERNPGICVFMDGETETVAVSYNTWPSGANARITIKLSTDGGDTFGDAITLNSSSERFGHGSPIHLSDNTLLVPCYSGSGGVYVEKSGVGNWATWTEYQVASGSSPTRNESSLVELKTDGSFAGRVACISRTQTSPYPYHGTVSTNYGVTWGTPAALVGVISPGFANPANIIRTSGDRIFLTFSMSNAMFGDTVERVILYESADELATWMCHGPILKYNCDYASHYSKMAELPNGDLGMIWCTNSSASDVYYNEYDIDALAPTGISVHGYAADCYLESSRTNSMPSILEVREADLDIDATYKYPGTFGFGRYHGATYNVNGIRRDIYTINKYFLVANTVSVGLGKSDGIVKDADFHTWKIVWCSGSATLHKDGESVASTGTNVPTADMPVNLGRTSYNAMANVGRYLYYFVRKYTANEPTWATPGEEQTA